MDSCLSIWVYLNGVELDFSRSSKPTDHAFIEALNGRFLQECLNENWFLSLEDAVEKVESWRRHYNSERPHSALGKSVAQGVCGTGHIGGLMRRTRTETGTEKEQGNL